MSIVVISTGGTIAMRDSKAKAATPTLNSDNLIDSIPELPNDINIKTKDFSNIPSPHFSVGEMYKLWELINKYNKDCSIDGIVVTQGTDILEESSYFVDLCYDGNTPVVFTGAMRHSSLTSPDGPANLLTAILTANNDEASNRGVLVTLNDCIYTAKEATKTHSMNLDTFSSPEFGPVGTRDEKRIRWHRKNNTTPTAIPDLDLLTNNVHAIYITADMHPSTIPDPNECEAVVIGALGAGHIPPNIIEHIKILSSNNIPLVATTRCPQGRLAIDTYDYVGSEVTLRKLGYYYSDSNLQKARIEAIIGIASNQLKKFFTTP